jgi:hypothetical protein
MAVTYAVPSPDPAYPLTHLGGIEPLGGMLQRTRPQPADQLEQPGRVDDPAGDAARGIDAYLSAPGAEAAGQSGVRPGRAEA